MATPSVVATYGAGTTSQTTTRTIVVTGGVSAGDTVVFILTSRNHTSGTALASISDDSGDANGWNLEYVGTNRKTYLWWKRFASAHGSFTITASGAVNSCSGVCQVISGAHTTSPIQGLTEEVQGSGDETHNGITTPQADSLVHIAIYNTSDDLVVESFASVTWATIGLRDGAAEHRSAGGSDCGAFLAWKSTTGVVSTGNATWNQSNTAGAISIMYAVVPPPPPQTVVAQRISLGVEYAQAVKALSPVVYYKLIDSSGSTADAEVGPDGTYVGSPSLASVAGPLASVSENVAAFSGSGQYVSASDNPLWDLGDGPLTIALWVKFTSATPTIYDGLSYRAGSGWFFHRKPSNHGTFPSRIAFGQAAGSTLFASTATITDTNWHFVVVTYNGGTSGRIYIDGVEGTSQAATATLVSGSDPLLVAHDPGNVPLSGAMGHYALFGSVLSAAEIAELYQLALSIHTRYVFSPSVEQSASGLVVSQLISNGRTLFNPSVSPGGVSVVAQLLSNTRSVNSPTITAVSRVVAQLIANNRSVNSPTITAVSAVVAQLITNASVVNNPSITQKVIAQLLTNTSSVNNPIVVAVSTVVTQLLSNTPTVNSPSTKMEVEALLLDQDNAVFDPSISIGALTVVAQLISASIQVNNPSVSPGAVSVSAQLIDNDSVLYSPAITQEVLAQLIVNATSVNAPIIQAVSQVIAQFLNNPSTVNSPSLSSEHSIQMLLLDVTPSVESPVVHATNLVTLDLLDHSITVHGPSVSSGNVVAIPLLDITPLVNEPVVDSGDVIVGAQLLAQVIQLFQPSVDPGEILVQVPHLDVVPSVPSPMVLAGMVAVQAHLLAHSPMVYPPGITQDQFITAQLIAQTVQVHSPDLSSIYRILAQQITQPINIFTPSAIPGGVVIAVGDLVVITNVNNPRVFVGVVPTSYQWSSQSDLAQGVPHEGFVTDDLTHGTQVEPTGQDDLERSS